MSSACFGRPSKYIKQKRFAIYCIWVLHNKKFSTFKNGVFCAFSELRFISNDPNHKTKNLQNKMDKEFYKPEPSAPYEPQLDPSFNPIPFEINSNEIQYYRPQPKAPQQHQPPTPPPAKPQAQQTYIDVLLVSFNFEMKDGEQTKTREYMFSLAVDQDNLMIFGGFLFVFLYPLSPSL